MDTPIKKPTHIVVEVFERDLCETRLCFSEDEAIEAANEMLDEYIKLRRADDDFDFERASKDCSNAWCNYDDEHWDAYIIELKED